MNRWLPLSIWTRISMSLSKLLPGGPGLWFGLLSIGFVLAALLRHGQAMLSLPLDRQGIGWLLLALGSAWLSLVINGLAWREALRWLGLNPGTAALVSLFLATNLKKYLPGGGWHLLARVQALRTGSEGLGPAVPTGIGLLAAVLDPLLMALAALALVPLGGWQGGLLLLGVAPLLLLALPHQLASLLSWLERQKARRLGITAEAIPELGQTPWRPWLAQLGFVLVRFLAFACCVQAFDLARPLGWAGWLAGFALAWTAGLVVPGAPGGIGVFEAVLLLRLSGSVPEAPLLAVALSYRLATTAADLLAAALGRLDGNVELRASSGDSQ